MLRHTVIEHGWDSNKSVGWMRFRCNRCGYEYRMNMYIKGQRRAVPPKVAGGKFTFRKMPMSEAALRHMAKWWGPKGNPRNDGCTVSDCKGCLPKRMKK